MTTYTIFMHYYNDKISKPVTNATECNWYPGLTQPESYKIKYQMTQDGKFATDPTTGEKIIIPYDHEYLQLSDMDQNRLAKDQEALEHIYIYYDTSKTVPSSGGTDTNDASDNSSINTAKYEELIVNSSRIDNPKYDMIFVWDGLGYYIEEHKRSNQLYFDKMKRIKFRPWFFHSTYHSLRAALTKANDLVDLFGKDHIIIGKEVDLAQFIDIV